MIKFFGNIKLTTLNIISILINITTLLYLVTLFGFNHINKEFFINTITSLGVIAFIITILVCTLIFIFYASFKLAYKKILEHIDLLQKQKN